MRILVGGDEPRSPAADLGFTTLRTAFGLMMAFGHAGKVMKLDEQCNVLGVTGSQGKGPNQYGEAHYIAVSARGEVYVADTLNWCVQKYARR